MRKLSVIALFLTAPRLLGAAKKLQPDWSKRKVAPTWLHRYIPAIPERTVDISTRSCHYKPIFGAGDSAARILQSIARFGEVTIDPNGSCKPISYDHEEQIYFVLAGSGLLDYRGERTTVRKGDFMYLPPAVEHSIADQSRLPLRLVIMGFRIPPGTPISAPAKLRVANAGGVKEQTDVGHPTSVLYRLLLGNRKGNHDRIDSGIVVTSLFLMDFAPGGTNFPHRHEIAEEIYLVLDGQGMMAAGGGMNGVEGLHPAHAGDAYFFRPNCTVGFYNSQGARAHILAVRSWVPVPSRDYEN